MQAISHLHRDIQEIIIDKLDIDTRRMLGIYRKLKINFLLSEAIASMPQCKDASAEYFNTQHLGYSSGSFAVIVNLKGGITLQQFFNPTYGGGITCYVKQADSVYSTISYRGLSFQKL